MSGIFREEFDWHREALEEVFSRGVTFLGAVDFETFNLKEIDFSEKGAHLLFKIPTEGDGNPFTHTSVSFKEKLLEFFQPHTLFDTTGNPITYDDIAPLIDGDSSYYVIKAARFKNPEQFIVQTNSGNKKKLVNLDSL